MEEYRIPAGPSEAELVEKKSRFIGQVFLHRDRAKKAL